MLAFVEARGITGPVRNILTLARLAQHVRFEIATYLRSDARARSRRSHAEIQECIDTFRRAGLDTHVLHERWAGDPRLIHQVGDLIRRTLPDIVETHHVKSHFLAAAARTGSHTPWIAFHHGYTTTDLRTRAYNLLDLWSLRHPAAIVIPCEAFSAAFTRAGIDRRRIAVVHNAIGPMQVDRSQRHAVRRAMGIDDHAKLIVAVGRLSREKGHATLIDALARPALAGRGDVHLLIAGDGPAREALLRQAAALGCATRVHLIGHQRDVWPYYSAADVVALPSHSEGSPNVLLEAMAAARPIVAARVGGIPEIIDDGRTGLLVPSRDPTALAAALAALLADQGRAAVLAANASAHVQLRFSPDRRAADLCAVYERMVRA